MKIEYINPFVGGVYKLFDTMLASKVERGDLALADKDTAGGDITAIIGLSGPARGTVALIFPLSTARSLVGRLLQLDEKEVDENVSDGVAELVNIVAGSAKAKFSNGDGTAVINLGLPTVIRGADYVVDSPREATWLEVPFKSDLGDFHLRVTFEFAAKKGAAA
jgi:chemotaxis protein CheX